MEDHLLLFLTTKLHPHLKVAVVNVSIEVEMSHLQVLGMFPHPEVQLIMVVVLWFLRHNYAPMLTWLHNITTRNSTGVRTKAFQTTNSTPRQINPMNSTPQQAKATSSTPRSMKRIKATKGMHRQTAVTPNINNTSHQAKRTTPPSKAKQEIMFVT